MKKTVKLLSVRHNAAVAFPSEYKYNKIWKDIWNASGGQWGGEFEMEAIETKRLTKNYGRRRGITELNLCVKEGDFYGFIGPNGAGKSTTIRMLLGFLSPSGGQAQIFGMDIVKEKTQILSGIGYLPSETMFYGGLKVRDILRFSADLRKQDCRKEAALLCERLELDVSRKIDELSFGNRKKVGIVCALQHKPRLYVLDEPTSGLDPLMQREFYTILKERNQEGATVFLSSHVLSEVQRYCSHAAIIREGRLLAADRVERLGHTGAKRVTLCGVTKPPALDGIKDIKEGSGTVSFLYSGTPGRLLKALSEMELTDVTVAEPDMEEVFMHYYGERRDVL